MLRANTLRGLAHLLRSAPQGAVLLEAREVPHPSASRTVPLYVTIRYCTSRLYLVSLSCAAREVLFLFAGRAEPCRAVPYLSCVPCVLLASRNTRGTVPFLLSSFWPHGESDFAQSTSVLPSPQCMAVRARLYEEFPHRLYHPAARSTQADGTLIVITVIVIHVST